ncbi:MAG: DNA methyltransferase [Collinsella sp.]
METWLDGYGTNSDATAELKAIFGSKVFDTPKPVDLVRWIVSLVYENDAIILDSFAGSGTTAHATLALNKEDGGSRRFILVEMMDYADTTTAERVRRVISGYDNLTPKIAKNAQRHFDGTGGGFSYYELGPALFDADGGIAEGVPAADLMRYVVCGDEGAVLGPHRRAPYLMGEVDGTAYYLAYRAGNDVTLGYDLLAELPVRGNPTVIYASRCVLPAEELSAWASAGRVPDQIARM